MSSHCCLYCNTCSFLVTNLAKQYNIWILPEQSSERALKAADRLYVLRSGQMQLEGKAADLQDGVKVRQAYFGFEDGAVAADEVVF